MGRLLRDGGEHMWAFLSTTIPLGAEITNWKHHGRLFEQILLHCKGTQLCCLYFSILLSVTVHTTLQRAPSSVAFISPSFCLPQYTLHCKGPPVLLSPYLHPSVCHSIYYTAKGPQYYCLHISILLSVTVHTTLQRAPSTIVSISPPFCLSQYILHCKGPPALLSSYLHPSVCHSTNYTAKGPQHCCLHFSILLSVTVHTTDRFRNLQSQLLLICIFVVVVVVVDSHRDLSFTKFMATLFFKK